jgi:hypothetical protein
MKRLKYVLSTFLILFIFNIGQAQTPTAAQKKAMQNAMNPSKNKVDASTIPVKYPFSWKYSMEMKTSAGKTMVFDYLLEPNANYYGANMKQSGSDMFMIMDSGKKLMVTSFGKGAKKMALASKIPDYSAANSKESKFTYKTVPNKVILGLNCKGVLATNSTTTMLIYYTNEAKVSFSEIFKSQQNQGNSNAFKDFFKPNEKPLMMSMDYKDLKDKTKSMTMKCISLKNEVFTFNKSDYQFM